MPGVVAFLKKVVREPLVHFLAAGVLLFGANALINGDAPATTGESITITEGKVNQIVESYFLLAGRLPGREEIEALVDDYVSEEIAYREAVAMGLDADDTIVRRRMRQKVEFLAEDATATDEPSEADLQAWLKEHPEDYRLPERRAIRQVVFSADRRGASVLKDAEAALAKLRAGADAAKLGDPSMLPAAVPLTTEEGIAAEFGAEIAAAAFAQESGAWFGPVASPFGQHLLLVMETEAGRALSLAEARDKVRSDWIEARRDKSRDDYQARMRARYRVEIQWPDPYKGLPTTPNPTPKTRALPEVGE